jgi:hypothetical protein
VKKFDRDRKYSWPPPKYDYVPADRLSVTIDTDSRFSSKTSWPETKTLRPESRLPDITTTFERWAIVDAERKDVERRAEIEKQERREREDELARQAYVQHALGERLVTDLNAWELTARLRRYLADMAEPIVHITDDEERVAALEWLEWCHRYAVERAPFTRPIQTPRIKAPGYGDVAEFRKRLGSVLVSGDGIVPSSGAHSHLSSWALEWPRAERTQIAVKANWSQCRARAASGW